MSKHAITVDGLSKKFKIGSWAGWGISFREAVVESLSAPLRWARAWRNRSRGDDIIWALRDVSFQVEAGRVIGIIGPNGAGKSTLLKILSRITPPTGGRAVIRGRVGSLLEVGTGFQPELTGRENIYLNGAILGMRKAEIDARFDAIVDFAEVGKFLDTPVKRYSSGMFVRLGFSVAAHLEPEIMIVDEVLAVGDSAFQKKCLGKMDDVAKRQGRTVLFVSHNMQAVKALCEQVVFLDQGQVADIGRPDEIIDKYLHRVMGGAEVAERVWEDPDVAPGDERVRVHAIRVQADADQRRITTETPILVECSYWAMRPGARLMLNLVIYSLDGAPVFESMSAEDPGGLGKPLEPGLYRSVCRLPAGLLNQGTFRAHITFMEDTGRRLFAVEEEPAFSVHDLADRAIAWYGQFAGYVHPKLSWRTRRVSRSPEQVQR